MLVRNRLTSLNFNNSWLHFYDIYGVKTNIMGLTFWDKLQRKYNFVLLVPINKIQQGIKIICIEFKLEIAIIELIWINI